MTSRFAPVSRRPPMRAHPAGVIFRPFTKPSSLALAPGFSHFSTSWVTECAGVRFERDLSDMEAKPAAEMALKYKKVIVGIKTAHYMGPDFAAVDRAVEAG